MTQPLRLVGLHPTRPVTDDHIGSLWMLDRSGSNLVVKWINIFGVCLQRTCVCAHNIGAVSQIKPYQVYAEVMCHGDTDPYWEVFSGACFGFSLFDSDCASTYFQKNCSSITNGEMGIKMGLRVRCELGEGLLDLVDLVCPPAWVCTKGP